MNRGEREKKRRKEWYEYIKNLYANKVGEREKGVSKEKRTEERLQNLCRCAVSNSAV